MTLSFQQSAILGWFVNGTGHLVVRARAGCGKTFIIIEGVKQIDSKRKVLVAAFSKIIQLELQKRIGSDHTNVSALTLHSVGLSAIKRYRERINVSFTSERADKLTDAVAMKAPDAIKRLISKLHTKGREINPHATKLGDLSSIQITFECEPDASWADMGFDSTYVESKALEAMALAANVKSGDTIDGSDMIFLPLVNGWLHREYDDVLIDEAQDMTPAQLEIARGVLKADGRIAVIGDNMQAIFGFRGADSDSLDRLKAELNATELGLTTTYRCGKNIVNLAAQYVPDFQAGENNVDGSVQNIESSALISAAGPGDFILSRVNAPLVSIAMQLLRSGKRAKVAGRDIGQGLVALIKKFKARSVPDLLSKIEAWQQREVVRLSAQLHAAKNGRKAAIEARITTVQDQADMLVSLTDGAKNVAEVDARIVALFADTENGVKGFVTCSSVHKAKGLEADRVFVLKDTLRNNSQEELNITYVAITRAKNQLVFVSDKEAA